MILQSSSSSSTFYFTSYVSRRVLCPCSDEHGLIVFSHGLARRRRKFRVQATNWNSRFVSSGIRGDSARRFARSLVVARFSNEFEDEEEESSSSQESAIQNDRNNFTNFREDPIVDKLRTQLGVIHPIPSPPINRNAIGLFAFFFFVGVVCDKLWTWRKRRRQMAQLPTSFALSLEKDLQRKESVEWVNVGTGSRTGSSSPKKLPRVSYIKSRGSYGRGDQAVELTGSSQQRNKASVSPRRPTVNGLSTSSGSY